MFKRHSITKIWKKMSRDKRNMKGEQEDQMNRKTRGTGRQEEYERQEEQEDKRNRKTRGTGRA